jgi:UDP-N-acetylmuramate dehydrogenase
VTTFAELTTLRVGGGARHWIDARTSDDIVSAGSAVRRSGDDWIALGGGSNLLVADAEFDGTVIRVLSEGIQIESEGAEHTLVHVQAGHSWDDFVSWAVINGLGGVEAMSGIPGTVGAAPVQNIGAYGQELAEVVHSLTFWDEQRDDVVTLTNADMDFSFRHSILKGARRGIVLDITFALSRVGTGPEALSRPIMFEQLASALGVAMGASQPLGAVRDRVMALRRSKGMMLDANDADTFSVGSFFVNPIVSERFSRTLPADAPRYPVGEEEPPRRGFHGGAGGLVRAVFEVGAVVDDALEADARGFGHGFGRQLRGHADVGRDGAQAVPRRRFAERGVAEDERREVVGVRVLELDRAAHAVLGLSR